MDLTLDKIGNSTYSEMDRKQPCGLCYGRGWNQETDIGEEDCVSCKGVGRYSNFQKCEDCSGCGKEILYFEVPCSLCTPKQKPTK